MASSKQTLASSLCMAAIFFLLFFTHSFAIRPMIPSPSPSPSFSVTPTDQLTMKLTSSPKDLEVERINNVEEGCEGNNGEEECLMRRTLAAHLDYIYTQKKNP
ncbi:hypothetical protein QN277_001286 [Acacia crassicarpa]|uniref:Phytosulfokine n=1 Tax=Acacia crassicarpa TaxID=499986 RepID=A0AAE1N8A8_9FABA|nr:hypothetical protein QN277_001286 [Acacia crassicarpa]